jgi:branched-chain amino acid aminotransferase
MNERIAYVNGSIVPESQATISIFDLGFQNGIGVFERTRTADGDLFRLDQHLARLNASLTMTRIDPGMSMAEIKRVTEDVAARNKPLRGPDGDYSVGHYISAVPGGQTAIPGGQATVVIFTEPIPFKSWARAYLDGCHVVTPSIRQMPMNVIDPKMKTTSRIHFHLGRLEAQLVDPEAIPLLLDENGNVCELAGHNFFIVKNGTLRTPPGEAILRGVTRDATLELAQKLGIPAEETTFQVYDVMNADEAFLTTTTKCIMPCSRINGRPIGTGKPGPVVERLEKGWAEIYGFDFVEQALRHLPDRQAARPEPGLTAV